MSTISPDSLVALTIDVISRNYQLLCIKKEDGCRWRLVFRDSESLPPNISENLLRQLVKVQGNVITSDILSLFGDPEVCHLRRFCIGANVSRSEDSYWEYFMSLLLKNQVLSDIDLGDLIIDFTVDYRHSKIAHSLKHLSLSCNDIDSINFILTFHHLKHLDVSNSGIIGDSQLQIFASTLLHLESLNVSSTNITSTEAFGELKVSLKSLYLYDTPLIWRDLTGLLTLTNLEVLDISQNSISGTDNEFKNMLVHFLTSTDDLPSLVSLDISGAGKINNEALKSFIEHHFKLRFLGLFNVEQTLYSQNCIPKDIEVTGDESPKQLLACLRCYKKRPKFLAIALRELHRFSSREAGTQSVQEREIVVKLLLELMIRYLKEDNKDLQIAASTNAIAYLKNTTNFFKVNMFRQTHAILSTSACLYGYIKEDNSSGPNSLHISILSEMVAVIIQVLKTFPTEKQIQRNCLLTLYKQYILANAKFDSFLLSKLILKAISLLPNRNTTAIGLDICAYLCAQISMEETWKLGTRENLERLLLIIKEQISSNTVDMLLHCALRVLWNLTDEAPKTCVTVVELDGLESLMKAMQTYSDKNDVLKKILGILNNLSEVVSLHPYLMTDELFTLLRTFLDSSYLTDVSYFAAGVICNLTINWPVELKFNCGTRTDFLSFVGTAVAEWKQPQKAMVGYRSFKPFIPLLQSQFSDVQLWATWAIYHVCFHRVARYSKICKDEGIFNILKELWSCPETRSDVKNLAMEAVNLIGEIKDSDSCVHE